MLKTKAVVKKPATVAKEKAKPKAVTVKKPSVIKPKPKAVIKANAKPKAVIKPKPSAVAVKKPTVAKPKPKPRKRYKGGNISPEQIVIVDNIINKFVEYSNERYDDRVRGRYNYIATDKYIDDINYIINNIRKLNPEYIKDNTITQDELKKEAPYIIDDIYSTLNDIVADIIIQEFLFNNDDKPNKPTYNKYGKLYNDRKETQGE